MNTLTEEQIKSLKLFAYYCQSYGGKEVDAHLPVYDCVVEEYVHEWRKGHGSPIASYQAIDDVIYEIINENDLGYAGDREDCENSGYIEINIDCVERKIRIKAGEYQRNSIGSTDTKDVEDLKDDENFTKFFENMKTNGFKRGIVTFDGGGDSGEIYDTIEYDGKFNEELPKEILEYLYDWLESFYGGWEINEGSHGSFTFFDNGSIELDFNEHTEDNVDLGEIFYAEF